MKKLYILLFFPLFLFSKIQAITYFPLESHMLKKITQDEFKIREISSRYIEEYRELPSSEISKLSDAKVYFHFGLEIEKKYLKLLKNKNPNLIDVDISKNIEKINANPYIWMDPFLMRDIAKNIYETVISLDKANEILYKNNYEKFLDEIDETFLKVKQIFNNSQTTSIYVLDDYWEYFAKRFRIKTIKREKKYLNIVEIPDLVKSTQKLDIKKILFSDNQDYNIILSISSNLNVKALEDDIFKDNWQLNLVNLAQNLSK